MTTLMFERVTIGLGGEGFGWRADRFAAARSPTTRRAVADREVRHRFGEIAAEFLALRFTGYRTLTSSARPHPGRRGRARQGDHDPRRDRRRRPDLRRARPGRR